MTPTSLSRGGLFLLALTLYGSWRLLNALSAAAPDESWGYELILPTLGAVGASICFLRRPPSRRVFLVLVAVGLLWRILVLAVGTPSALSDDIHRYRFEGHVVLEGVSPYRHAPDSPIHDAMVQKQDLGELRSAVDHPRIATIYPVLAELSFALAAALERGMGAGPKAWLVLVFLFELGLIRGLARWLAARGQRREWLLLYLFLPLPWMEGVLSGHVDIAALTFLVAAAAAAAEGKSRRVWAFLAISILFKVLAVFLLPLFLTRRGLLAAGTAGAVVVAATVLALAHPDFGRGPSVDDGILAKADNGIVVRRDDEGITIHGGPSPARPKESPDWDDLLGRYRFVFATDSAGVKDFELEFDGRGRSHRPHEFWPLIWVEDGWYQQDAAGVFRIHQARKGRPHFDVRVSDDRSTLIPVQDAPTGIKEGEDPLMGWRQYGGRWTAHAPLFRQLTRPEDGDHDAFRERRKAAQRWLILAVLVFGGFARWRGFSRDGALGTALAILLLGSPVIYPWYLLWLLPFAIIGRRWGLAGLTILAPALHLMSDPPQGISSAEWWFWGTALAFALIGFVVTRRSARVP